MSNDRTPPAPAPRALELLAPENGHKRLELAVALASKGHAVFPCRVRITDPLTLRKQADPVGPWRNISTTDTDVITGWWQGPYADCLPAVDTGKSHLVVIDLDDKDGKHGSNEWAAVHPEPYPMPGYVATTLTGGKHLAYRADPRRTVSIDSSGKVAKGVDVRGDGGFVIAWGTAFPRLADLPPVPEIVIERMGGGTRPVSSITAAGVETDSTGFFAIYKPLHQFTWTEFTAAAAQHLDRLRTAGRGEINQRLNDAAMYLGHFIPRGFVTRPEVERELREAQRQAWTSGGGLDDGDYSAADATIRSGLRAGIGEPYEWRQEAVSEPGEPPVWAAPVDPDAGRKFLVGQAVERMLIQRDARIAFSAIDRVAAPAPTSLANMLLLPDEPTAYRLDGLMPSDGISLLYAAQKSGKTTAIGNLIRSLVDGEKFLDAFSVTRRAKVAIIDTESGEQRLRAWLREQRIINTSEVGVFSLRGLESSLDVRDRDCRAIWLPMLEGFDVAVLDVAGPVLAALGMDENNNTDVGQFIVGFRGLLQEAGVSEGVLVHHAGHNEDRATGASAWLRYPDAIWGIKRENENPTSPRYFGAYGRDVEVQEALLEYDSINRRLRYTGTSKTAAKAGRFVEELAGWLRVVGRKPKEACANYLHDEFDVPRDLARRVPDQGVHERLLRRSQPQPRDNGRAAYYEVSDLPTLHLSS